MSSSAKCPGAGTLLPDVRYLVMPEIGLRVLRVHRLERVDEDAADHPVPEPLVVRGDDVPRRLRGRRPLQHLRSRGLVLGPQLAFGEVFGLELPALRRRVETR